MKSFPPALCLAFVLAGCQAPHPESETRPAGVTGLSASVLDEALFGRVDFRRHVAPILQAKCLYCHQPSAMPGHLSLVSREAAFASGPYIIPGQPNASPLIRTLGDKAHLAMPAVGNQVTPEEIRVLKRWIQQGAVWPDGPAGLLQH